MPWTALTIPSTLGATLILALVFLYLYGHDGERYLVLWAWGLMAGALRFAVELFGSQTLPVFVASQLFALLNVIYIFQGTQLFLGRQSSRAWHYAWWAICLWTVAGPFMHTSFFRLTLPLYAFSAFVHVWAGVSFLRSKIADGLGQRLVGWALILWGIHKLDYPLLRPVEWLAPWAYQLSAGLGILVALGMLLLYLERARSALRENEARFHRLVEHAQDVIFRFSLVPEGHVEYLSPSVESVTGYAPADFYADRELLAQVVHLDSPGGIGDRANLSRIGQRSRCILVSHKDGTERWVEEKSVPVCDPTGRVVAVEGVARDVTARRKAEAAARRYHILSEQTGDMILFADDDGRIIEANEAAAQGYGCQREELLRLRMADLRTSASIEHEGNLKEDAREQAIRFETTHRRKDGTVFPVEVSCRTITVEGQEVVASIIRDITERRRAEREIRYLSFHDRLTGLYNRAFFEETANRLDIERRLPFSVIVGDVNGLKLVNDTFGPQTGDDLLKAVASTLAGACRSGDIVARWGGDEFAILLPETAYLEASKLCERITQACAKNLFDKVPLSIALGTATKIVAEQDMSGLLRVAEDQMYRHKLLESKSRQSSMIVSLGKALWERSHETEEHAERMRQMALSFGAALDLSPSQLDELSLLATLHDIGKVAIPNEILEKPESLLPDEWEVMKKHPEIGCRIVQASSALAGTAEAILAHHERWDGTGYPHGLRAAEIPLVSRALAIVDAFDVMTHARPYKKAMGVEQALAEVSRCAGTQFDPTLAGVFVEMFESRRAELVGEGDEEQA